MFQAQGDGDIIYHENQTVDLTLAWMAEIRAKVKAEKEKA